MVQHCTTGAPVSVTAADYLAMPEDQRQIIRTQAMAYAGAVDRVRNHGTTLTTAFHAELDYQASIQRGLSRNMADGKSKRITKTQSKIDKKAGRPPAKVGGVASFKRGPRIRVETVIDQHMPYEVPGHVKIEKLRRSQVGLLALNARQTEK
jgi:hypothetical protein